MQTCAPLLNLPRALNPLQIITFLCRILMRQWSVFESRETGENMYHPTPPP